MLVTRDDGGHNLRYKIFDFSLTTWDVNWTDIDTGIVDSTTFENAMVGAVQPDQG